MRYLKWKSWAPWNLWLFRLIKLAGVTWAILITVLFFNNMVNNDITTSPAYSYQQRNQKYGNKKYLISYADGRHIFYKNQNALALSALNRGFDVIINYNRQLLDIKFLNQHRATLNLKIGAGYWLWKPWIILDTMQKAPEDAIIVYADAGFVFTKSIQSLVDSIINNNKDGLLIEYTAAEYGTVEGSVQRQTLIDNNCDTMACRKAPLIMAGFIILKNNQTSRKFIEKWLELCKNPKFLIDNPKAGIQHEKFTGHRHDMALLSLTQHLQSHNFILHPFKTMYDDRNPYWAHRKYNDEEYNTLLPHIYRSKFSMVYRRFLNIRPFVWLRKKFA